MAVKVNTDAKPQAVKEVIPPNGAVALKEDNALIESENNRREYLTGRDNLFIIMEDQYHNVR